MATHAQCREAFDRLAQRMATDTDPARREVDKSFSCQVTDLRADFHGRISHGAMVGLDDGADPRADIKLDVTSDDLIALVDGRLNVAAAWASGRLHIHASFRDLLRLRKLL